MNLKNSQIFIFTTTKKLNYKKHGIQTELSVSRLSLCFDFVENLLALLDNDGLFFESIL